MEEEQFNLLKRAIEHFGFPVHSNQPPEFDAVSKPDKMKEGEWERISDMKKAN